MKISLHLIVSLAFVLFTPLLCAQQPVGVQCSVTADRFYVGDSVTYIVNVSGSSAVEQPTLVLPNGLEAEFSGGSDRSTRFVGIDGSGRRSERTDSGYVFQFKLTASKTGDYVLPAPRVRVNGKEFQGTSVAVRVVEPENSDQFALTLGVDNPRPYVGEPITLRIIWQLASSTREINISKLPGLESFDIATPRGRIPVGGQQNDPARVEFQMFGRLVVGTWTQGAGNIQGSRTLRVEQVIVPKQAGTFQLGPMSIAFDAVVGMKQRTFFDAPWDNRDVTRRMAVRSEPITITVRELPAAGRPDDFTGLVGEYKASSSASATSVGVGDPISLTLSIDGPDPLDRVPAPTMIDVPGFTDNFKASPEGWVVDNSSLAPRRLTLSVRAAESSVREIPAIEFPYFDPKRGEYRHARTDPIALTVRPTRVVTTADAIGRTPGAETTGPSSPLVPTVSGLLANIESPDIVRDEGGSVVKAVTSPLGVAVLATPVIAYAVLFLFTGRRGTRTLSRSHLRTALKRAETHVHGAQTPSECGDAIRAFLGTAWGRGPGTLTSEDCANEIRARWAALAIDAEQLLRDCDANRFGDVELEPSDIRARTLALLRALCAELGRELHDRKHVTPMPEGVSDRVRGAAS